MDRWKRDYGYRLDHFERKRKKTARDVHKHSKTAQKVSPTPTTFLSLYFYKMF